MTQHCALAAQKATCVLHSIQNCLTIRMREGILPMCPAQEFPTQEQHRPVGASSEEAMKMIRKLKHLCSEHKPRELRLLSFEKRRLQGVFTAAYPYLKAVNKEAEERLFRRADSERPRGNGFKLTLGWM